MNVQWMGRDSLSVGMLHLKTYSDVD